MTIVALPVKAMPEESRQSLFETGREVGKRDRAMLALSPKYPPPLRLISARVQGAEECERRRVAKPADFINEGKPQETMQLQETSPVELIP